MHVEENVDEAMRVEVFRLYSEGASRRRQPKEYTNNVYSNIIKTKHLIYYITTIKWAFLVIFLI